MTVDEILISARQAGASDIHMIAEEQPMMRVRGRLLPMNWPWFSASQILDMLIQLLPQQLREQFEEKGYSIGTYVASDGLRYRVSAYRQRSMAALAVRVVGDILPGPEELPEYLLDAAGDLKGLILISGSAGSGRSTTLAALGQYLGKNHPVHIMTLGYTVEHLLQCPGAVISQRVLEQDVPGLVKAIEEAGRMDVDVLLLDVLEGQDAVRAAIKAVAGGLLVVAVVRTGRAGGAVQGLLEQFSLAERGDMERQLRHLPLLEIYQELGIQGDDWKVSYQYAPV